MSGDQSVTRAGRRTERWKPLAGALVLLAMGLVAGGLIVLVVGANGSGTAAPSPPARTAFSADQVVPAPPLDLINQDGEPFSLTALRGHPILVFFGYTHCPDVCPANVGVINEALAQTRPGPRVVLVTVDPERDDVAAMTSYLRYLPTAYIGLTGSPEAIRREADGWGVQFARIDEGASGDYGMAHTADIFLVDGQGRMRARFPFGTEPASIASALAQLLAESPVTSTAAPSVTSTAAPPAARGHPGPRRHACADGGRNATAVHCPGGCDPVRRTGHRPRAFRPRSQHRSRPPDRDRAVDGDLGGRSHAAGAVDLGRKRHPAGRHRPGRGAGHRR